MTQIDALLSSLEDPFRMFPFHAVAKTLADSVAESREHLAQRAGWWGVSSRYRTVDEEHEVEVIWLLTGSAFVLGQTAITEAVAITKKLRHLAGAPSWLPSRKADILKTEATIHPEIKLSEVVLFDAIANYFKHHLEWPPDWSQSQAKGPQCDTIEVIQRLGLSPNSDDNLALALQNLGFGSSGVGAVGERIQAWREALAAGFRRNLHEHLIA